MVNYDSETCRGLNMKPVCLVIGAGAGIGGHVGKRFAMAGYHAVLCRRSDEEGLARLVQEIEEEGCAASGFLLNVAEENSIESRVAAVEAEIGPIEVVAYNIGAQIGDRALADTSYKSFELGWRLATFGLFRLASVVCPLMAQRGKGTILVTSATAAVRGNRGQHSHAAAMGGRRMLCQTLNGEFAPRGIHVAHVLIDGAVDAPDTLGKMLGPERFQQLRESRGLEHDGLILPAAVAETYFHLAGQHRSAWTHEIDLRAYSDTPWWNHD
jgi:NAD(P)-dependent dehydrogenase (short-subunit alcohol dehydrogenase family)